MKPFLDRDEFEAMLATFGESCRITSSSVAYEVSAIFDDADQEVAVGMGLVVGQPMMEVWYEDAPLVADGFVVDADGESFTVKTVEHDRLSGVLTCGLRRRDT